MRLFFYGYLYLYFWSSNLKDIISAIDPAKHHLVDEPNVSNTSQEIDSSVYEKNVNKGNRKPKNTSM